MWHVCVVDDEPSMREYLEVLLTRAGYRVTSAGDVAAFKAVEEVDLVVSDMKLAKESGLDVLRLARSRVPAPQVILITAYGTPATAVEAMRQGAYDYICKPFDNDELVLLVERALEKQSLLSENVRLRSSLIEGGRRVLLGSTDAMKEMWALVERVAAAGRSTVLITGESGTGKEIVARAIHYRSGRAAHPFLGVNCAALAEGVLESELFGHVKGAYTGAASDRQGILVAAGEGTVLLDEISEVSPAVQVALLRVLQERRVKPVGSSTEVPFNARILVASNKRMDEEVKAGRFREDLYFRLNVISLEVPPLRDRKADIQSLANFFLLRFAEELARPGLRFTPEAMSVLEGYDFPGNVRQLENIVERAATLSVSDALGPESLPPALRGEPERARAGVAPPVGKGFSLERYLDDAEQGYLLEALKQAGGVKTKAAELLGLSFRSFRYRLAKHGLADRDDAQ